jgi:formylglycine-generating enzyme required for sulfatase activity
MPDGDIKKHTVTQELLTKTNNRERTLTVKPSNPILCLHLCLALMVLTTHIAKADTFGTGSNQFSIDFTSIGNAGNASDPLTGYGSVGYNYRIGTYTISQNQLNAAVASGLQNVTAGPWSGDQPATYINWYEAASFVNWLNTSTGYHSAYNLSWNGAEGSVSPWNSWDAGYNSLNESRNSLAHYFLPDENEWYKAAYGKSDGTGYYLYPTGSDTPPVAVSGGTASGTAVFSQSSPEPSSVYQAGGLSSYGTMGQGGNVGQLLESRWVGATRNTSLKSDFVVRGNDWVKSSDYFISSYDQGSLSPTLDAYYIGIRVASVPEPSTYALFGLGTMGILIVLRGKKTA